MLRQYALLAMIGLAFTLDKSSRYVFTKDTCHFGYGVPLGQWETINDMQCVKTCMQHENCTSLMYETATRQCFLNAEIMENENQFPADCGVQYAAPVEGNGVQDIGCDVNWQYAADKCYFRTNKGLTWHGCGDFCIKENAYIAKLYNLSTYPILWNVTYQRYAWISVNDILEENAFTDRDGVPIISELIPTMQYNSESYDCGLNFPTYVHLIPCKNNFLCLCEKEPIIIPKRPNSFK